jgi:hypothetical protein
MIRMAQFARILLAAVVAIVSTSLTAATGHAEPPTEGAVQDTVVPIRLFDREVNTLLLPQLREPDPATTQRRPPKATTLLQLDAPVGEDSDLMFRVQAKQKQFLFLEFRF